MVLRRLTESHYKQNILEHVTRKQTTVLNSPGTGVRAVNQTSKRGHKGTHSFIYLSTMKTDDFLFNNW